ncbi:nucleoporin Nup188 [Musca vetustissima]|uniref:nucleoporin Nup188 n=1 Tax=Musca vetustissima TaxID=27455 RepID=UPI002AB74CD3|nr:nucleoporin Nup188 [Musca vetustissima]
MANATKNVITDWKKLWQLVSGIHHETPESTVLEELTNVSQELQDGLLQFKTSNDSKTTLEKLLAEKKQEKLLPFTIRLQELLDLESVQCWEILCFYLANEYRGSASSLTTLISTENNMTQLLDDIWGYYTLERLIVLKIVKNLLIFYRVPNHPYHNEYKQIVNKIGMDKLRESYIKQLEHLINEAPPHKLTNREFFNYQSKLVNWSERNAREIIEVSHIIILLCDHRHFNAQEIKRLFNCFKQHSFGRQQSYLNASANALHFELLTRLAYAELALFLKCLDFKRDSGDSKPLANSVFKELDKDVTGMCHHPENGPMLMSWMLMQIQYTDAAENEEHLMRCRKMGKRAVDLNCFKFLHDLLSNSMFKDDSMVSRIVRKTIYNMLSQLCEYFDGDGSCSKHPFIYELVCELLSWPTLAKEFCSQEEGGVRSLYDTLLEMFPLDFAHLSMIATALTKAGMGNYVRQNLESLPILTDVYDETRFHLKPLGGDDYVLGHTVKPFPRIDFYLPEGTQATVLGRPEGYCVHFRLPVNYFNVLHHEINSLLTETMHYHGDYENTERVRRVNEGLKYLHAALKKTKSLQGISVEMVHPTEMCIDLLNKFKALQKPPIELLANALNVCTALLPLADAEIFIRVINLSILPVISNDSLGDYKKYAHGSCFDSLLVGSYLVDIEKKRESFEFLQAYLGFLRTYTKLQRRKYFQVEIPGLIFLLRDVFPHLHVWRFKSQQEKYTIYAEIMGFICDILDEFTALEKDKEVPKDQLLLRDICVYSMLNMENGIILLRFVALGNAYLQHCMEMESNWMIQQSHGLVLLVRLSMRILMQVLKLKSTIFDSSELSPLEAMIYTQPKQRDTLRIIPVVTRYMSNIFDRWLPILSCRLLKRIALEFNMSLLACLDMEADQIRMTFLQKLPDELESDSIKIAILELVESCIAKQPGVTEAFFKVNYNKEKRIFGKESDTQISDSIVTYMEDYLEAVSKDPQIVEQTLPSKIMNLYHMLWKQNMQILVDSLAQKDNFWDKLCKPLFGEYKSNVKAYTQLLNILGIEIFSNHHKPNSDLKKVVAKLFDAPHFEKWIDFVFDLPRTAVKKPHEFNPEEMPEWLCRLQAFKSFLLILLKKQPAFMEIPRKQFKLLAQKTLNILVERAEYVEDLRPLIIISELYLFIILGFKHAYTESSEEHRNTLKQLNNLLAKVASCYADLHVRAKEACLSIAIKCADLLSEELTEDSSLSMMFLHSVVNIICSELHNLENCVKIEINSKKSSEELKRNPLSSSNSLILCLNLLKTIAAIFHNDGFGNWDLPFITNKVFQRLLSCTGSILQLHNKQQLSVELLDVLIVFAKGNCSAEFLHCDVGDYLWLKLLPPKELLEANYSLQPKESDWTVHKWWPIYARGIELVTILFQKHSYHFLKETLQFVGIHEEYLVDSLLLSKQSLEPSAMRLIKSCATLLSNLVLFEKQWRLEHSQSLFNLMRSVQILLSHAIAMFHQPKNLKLLIAGRRSQLEIIRDSESAGLVDEAITAFNDLTEIIILCVKCLQAFSPNLVDLICEPEFAVFKWEPIFEICFGAPKLSENAVHLTFGTVLSIVGVYTKVLNLQNYGFHEVPLNVLPEVCRQGGSATSSGNTSITKSPQAHNISSRPFSKSLSVASVSSINCPPNELLSNLDGELCLVALEHILTLAASQSLLALKNPSLPTREKQLIRREISSELLSYHEFVRKKVVVDFREHNKIWHRRKHGQVLMQEVDSDKDLNGSGASTSQSAASVNMQRIPPEIQRKPPSSDLRVNVVRRLHLQQQQQQRTPGPSGGGFEMSRIISPIGGGATSKIQQPPAASTPALSRPPLRRPGDANDDDYTKRVHIADEASAMLELQEEEEDIYFPPEEPKYSALSYIQFVEEDYLHFMSNLFFVICQND